MEQHEFLEKTLAFLGSIGVVPPRDGTKKFYVDVHFDSKGRPADVYSSATDTVIRISIREEEWSVYANVPPQKASHVRVRAEGAFVHGRDAFGLLEIVPPIAELGDFILQIERKLGVKFPRVAFVRTNVAGAKKAVRSWVASL